MHIVFNDSKVNSQVTLSSCLVLPSFGLCQWRTNNYLILTCFYLQTSLIQFWECALQPLYSTDLRKLYTFLSFPDLHCSLDTPKGSNLECAWFPQSQAYPGYVDPPKQCLYVVKQQRLSLAYANM
uniref:Uncharacterized protein n=1 Tax=Anguilla anguilla TaxID=7936 RepID=A0A0E9R1V5_ANGAN